MKVSNVYLPSLPFSSLRFSPFYFIYRSENNGGKPEESGKRRFVFPSSSLKAKAASDSSFL
jgi:hypothetical protein